jgi:hypothetical protein
VVISIPNWTNRNLVFNRLAGHIARNFDKLEPLKKFKKSGIYPSTAWEMEDESALRRVDLAY